MFGKVFFLKVCGFGKSMIMPVNVMAAKEPSPLSFYVVKGGLILDIKVLIVLAESTLIFLYSTWAVELKYF